MNLSIAGFIIRINFIPLETKILRINYVSKLSKLFKGFLLNTEPKKYDFTINFKYIKPNKIINRREKYYLNIYDLEADNCINTFYWINIFEFKTILIDILQRLLSKNKGFMLHAAATNVNNYSYVFLGPDGAGKSTITNLLSSKYKKLADDWLIIRKEEATYYLYQMPTVEKSKIKKSRRKYKLKGFYFLRKSHDFKIEPIENLELISLLLIKQLLPEGEVNKTQIKYLFDLISTQVSFSWFYFTKNTQKLSHFIT